MNKEQTLKDLQGLTTQQIIELATEYNNNNDIKLYLIFALAIRVEKLEETLKTRFEYLTAP